MLHSPWWTPLVWLMKDLQLVLSVSQGKVCASSRSPDRGKDAQRTPSSGSVTFQQIQSELSWKITPSNFLLLFLISFVSNVFLWSGWFFTGTLARPSMWALSILSLTDWAGEQSKVLAGSMHCVNDPLCSVSAAIPTITNNPYNHQSTRLYQPGFGCPSEQRWSLGHWTILLLKPKPVASAPALSLPSVFTIRTFSVLLSWHLLLSYFVRNR